METLKQKHESTRSLRTRAAIGAVTLIAALGASEARPAAAEAHSPHGYRLRTGIHLLERKTQLSLERDAPVRFAHGTLVLRKKIHHGGAHASRYVTTKFVENPVIADRMVGTPDEGPVKASDIQSGRYAFGSISRTGNHNIKMHELNRKDLTVEFIPDQKVTTPDNLVQTVGFMHDQNNDILLDEPLVKNAGAAAPLLDPTGAPTVIAMEHRAP